jgi:flavin reductase (DIM6/NTAB) family NADH-FMN oxidoreductase RutF
MKKRSIKPFRPVQPSPAALVSCVSPEGSPNIITLAEVFNISISSPVILGIAIAKERYSHELITATREYVVNMPTAAMVEVVDLCGTVSGRSVDKFSTYGLTPVPAEKARPPLIGECPISVECRVTGIHETGDHDLFLGEAVAEHVAEQAIGPDHSILVEQLDPLCYLHGEYWSCGKPLGRHGYSRK